MDKESFRFKIGEFDCIAATDGTVDYHNPGATFFADASTEELENFFKEAGISRESWQVYPSPYISVCVAAGDERILIDTGAGALTPGTGQLTKNLVNAGISPDEVTMVILTHGHPDHIGGIMRDGKAVYPNARYLIARKEWNYWFHPDIRSMLPVDEGWKTIFLDFAEKNLCPIKDQIVFLDDDCEILPGITALICPGHTPGHLVVRLESSGERLYFLSDLVLHPLNIEKPEWGSVFDGDRTEAAETRKRILKRIASEKAYALGFHFPFPGLGRVLPFPNGTKWETA